MLEKFFSKPNRDMKYMNNINRLYSEYATRHEREKFKGIAISIIFCRWDNKYITWRKVFFAKHDATLCPFCLQ